MKATVSKRPWSHAIVATLAGLPKETEVVEVDQQFHVDVLPKDYKSAIQGDPCRCALAQAAQRQCGLPATIHPVITSGAAYIPMRKGTGWFLAKYAHTSASRAGLIEFDETGAFPEGGMTFIPLAQSKRMLATRAQEAKRNQERKDGRQNHQGARPATVPTARRFRPLSGVVIHEG